MESFDWRFSYAYVELPFTFLSFLSLEVGARLFLN